MTIQKTYRLFYTCGHGDLTIEPFKISFLILAESIDDAIILAKQNLEHEDWRLDIINEELL